MFCMIRIFSKDKFLEKVPQCSVKCSALRPSGVCKKKVCQLNLRRRRENTRKYANPLSSRESRDEVLLLPDGGKKCSLFCVFPSGSQYLSHISNLILNKHYTFTCNQSYVVAYMVASESDFFLNAHCCCFSAWLKSSKYLRLNSM